MDIGKLKRKWKLIRWGRVAEWFFYSWFIIGFIALVLTGLL